MHMLAVLAGWPDNVAVSTCCSFNHFASHHDVAPDHIGEKCVLHQTGVWENYFVYAFQVVIIFISILDTLLRPLMNGAV